MINYEDQAQCGSDDDEIIRKGGRLSTEEKILKC